MHRYNFSRFSPLVLLMALVFVASACIYTSPDGTEYDIVDVYPGQNLQSIINAHPEETIFALHAGTYYGQHLQPKNSQRFIGGVHGPTIFNGNGGSAPAFTANLNVRNVLIKGIEFTNYNPWSYGAVIDASSQNWNSSSWDTPTDWAMRDLYIHDNGGAGDSAGLEVGSGSVVRNVRIERSNGLGIFGHGRNITIRDSRIVDNARGASNVYYHSGGMKLVIAQDVKVLNNEVAGNNGPGIWFDINGDNNTIAGNNIYDNSLAGIHYEISRGAQIRNNTLTNNAQNDTRGWFHQAQLTVSSSYNVSVTGNRVQNGPGGITVIDQRSLRSADLYSTPSWGRLYENGNLAMWRSENVTVTGNTLSNTGRSGATAGSYESSGSNVYSTTNFSGNSFSGNNTFYWGTGDNYGQAVGSNDGAR
jgi:parallel beta-helix repeat protein